MKWYKVLGSFVPARKCGNTPIIGDIFGFVENERRLGVSQDNVYTQLQAQHRENELNRDWQTQQAEIDRQFQSSQTQQQNQFQQGLQAQQQQYNLQSMQQQAQYNSPVYMRQQLQQAGINPQVYFGNHASFSGSSAVSGGAPAAPSAPSGRMPGSVQGLSPVGFQPNFLNPVELFNGIAQGMKALGEAKKAGVETSFLERSLESRIQKALSEGNMAKQQELLGELEVAFNKANFGTRLNTAFANYKKVLSEIDLNSEKKLTEQEEQKLKKATALMNKSIQALNEEEKRKLGITISYLPRLLESEILSNRGSAAAGFGTAKNQRSLSKLNDLTYEIQRNVQGTIENTYLEQLRKLQGDNAISDQQLKIAEATAEIQRTAANHSEVLFWKDFFIDILHAGADLGRVFVGFKNAKAFQSLSDSSKERVKNEIEELKYKYGEHISVTSGDSETETHSWTNPWK